jgi:dGTPase
VETKVHSLIRTRAAWAEEEEARLGPWAERAAESRGRVHAEPEHAYRSAFQRDRDRVVHSRAFRRLEYKTQVFVHREDDHFRNRLTHTLEGSQVARTLARALRVNEDLAEAIVLAHDLGHTPFGHAGERALDALLSDAGGFDHNRQTLRVVDWLEDRYPGFRGLNLTAETREGILKHGCHWEHPVPVPDLGRSPSLEAQISDAADEIAYVSHDLDDGLRAGLLDPSVLSCVDLWRDARTRVDSAMPGASESVKNSQTVRSLLDALVTDWVEATAGRVSAVGAASPADVRAADRLGGHSEAMGSARRDLKRFLFENLYDHPDVMRVSREAELVVGELYRRYRADVDLLPAQVRARFEEDGEVRAIADYIAGMTDRFARAEFEKLEEAGA